MESKQLEPGEKYLSVQISAKDLLYEAHKAIADGKDKINFPAFTNPKAVDDPQQPKWHSSSIAIWENKKKAPESTPVKEEAVTNGIDA